MFSVFVEMGDSVTLPAHHVPRTAANRRPLTTADFEVAAHPGRASPRVLRAVAA